MPSSSTLLFGERSLDLSRPRVMGILNVTPDSFSDGGRFVDRERALAHARRMVADGADIIDIGGESTRPGAAPVSADEERERVVPLVEALARDGIPVSVDTMKPDVMRAALAAGAGMINDVRALQAPGALAAVAAGRAAVCLMHMRGEPRTMQDEPHYTDVVTEVRDFLVGRARACEAAGIARGRIVIDPGFGFGKTVAHNLALLRALRVLVATGYPVLAGLSRKSMLGVVAGRDVNERAPASVAAALAAVVRGAAIVRVHDVRETVDALKVWQAIEAE
jgi:dihydropteroate synthase